MAEQAYSQDSKRREVEEWKPVLGWEGFYEVSSLGNVRSLPRTIHQNGPSGPMRRIFPGKMLKLNLRPDGYLQVTLSAEGALKSYLVHRLVCEAFIGPQPDSLEAAHNDGNRANNNKRNLRWDTHRNNMADQHWHGTRPFGEGHPNSRLTANQVCELRAVTGKSELREKADELGIARGYAREIQRGRRFRLF